MMVIQIYSERWRNKCLKEIAANEDGIAFKDINFIALLNPIKKIFKNKCFKVYRAIFSSKTAAIEQAAS